MKSIRPQRTSLVAADAPLKTRDWAPRAVAIVAIAIGVGLRTFFLLTPEGAMDGDEAVTGIMAHRMARFDDFYVFFAGQTYNGTIEQFAQALLFRLGVPENASTLRLPQLALGALSCWLLYLVGRRILKSDWHAALASVLFALGPYFLIWDGARSIGGYVVEIVVVLLGVLCVLRMDEEHDATRQRRFIFGFGLCFGMTYWLTLSGYYVLVPAALWVIPVLWRNRKSAEVAIAGVLVGLLPILSWTAANGRFPLPNPRRPATTAAQRFGNLTDPIGREFLGVAHLYGRPGWPVDLGRVLVASLLAGTLAALVFRRRSVVKLLTFRRDGRRPLDIVVLAVPLMIAAYVASSYAWFIKEPRYLFCVYPVLILGLAALPPRRRVPGIAVAAVLVALVGAPSVTMLVTHADDAPAHRDRDLRRAVSLLGSDGVTHVYADYWTAMPLQFIAEDRLTVGSLTTSVRFPEDRRAVDAAAAPVWVAAHGINADDIAPMRRALVAARIRFRERRLGVVSLFDRFSRPVRPWQIGLASRPG